MVQSHEVQPWNRTLEYSLGIQFWSTVLEYSPEV